MSIFGLDIGPTSTKMVQLDKDKNKFRFVAAGITPTPYPGLMSESEKDLQALADILKKLYKEAHITAKKVVFSLPEGYVFTRVVELPSMTEDELAQAIPWEAEKFIPKPLTEVTLDWQIVSPGGVSGTAQQMKVFLVAAPNLLIEKYLKVCEMSNFEVAAIETEIIAAARALVLPSSPPSLLLDLGAKTTSLAIVSQGKVVMTRSIPTAGEALTRAISSGLSMEINQAEEYKRAYGLNEKEFEGKIRAVLTPVFEIIEVEIKKAIAFWQEKERVPISSVVLSGGTANLPEVATLLAQSLELEVQIASPFTNLTDSDKITRVLKGDDCQFSVAVGLAQKEI